MTWRVGPELSLAQLQATIMMADTGAGQARVRLYTDGRPAVLGGASGAPQAEVVLAKPCATIVGGVLVLHPQDSSGALVMRQGLPRWGAWVSASGVVLADGTVTDLEHGGDFRVTGGETPQGESSPLLYAGALVVLRETALT